MNNLDKVKLVWNNLDDKYNDYCNKSKVISKLDFIKFLLGFDGKNSKLTTIINNISDCSNDQDYNGVVNTLCAVDKVIKKDIIEEIKDFGVFIEYCIKTDTKNTRSLPIEFLQSLQTIDESWKDKKCSLSECMFETGLFDEVYKFDKDKNECIHLNPSNVSCESYFLSSTESANEIMQDYNDNKDNKFMRTLIEVIMKMFEDKDLKIGSIFLNSSYFERDNNRIKIIGDKSDNTYTIREQSKIRVKSGCFCRIYLNNGIIKSPVYCYLGDE